jgi:hypothetical protein
MREARIDPKAFMISERADTGDDERSPGKIKTISTGVLPAFEPCRF